MNLGIIFIYFHVTWYIYVYCVSPPVVRLYNVQHTAASQNAWTFSSVRAVQAKKDTPISSAGVRNERRVSSRVGRGGGGGGREEEVDGDRRAGGGQDCRENEVRDVRIIDCKQYCKISSRLVEYKTMWQVSICVICNSTPHFTVQEPFCLSVCCGCGFEMVWSITLWAYSCWTP